MKKLFYYNIRLAQLLGVGVLVFILADHLAPLPMAGVSAEKFARLVVAQDGTPLRAFADKQGVWRYPVTMEAVSPRYIKTLLAYEDRWFWYHPGINPAAMLRASWQNLSNGRIISGGSTLTMQVARILDPHSRTVSGKLKQMFRALQLEWHYSKSEILTLYLNLAPFGGPIEGVQAASYAYLSKPVKELSMAEAALLTVLPQSPTRFRPDKHPDRATAARNKVLQRLYNFGYLSSEQLADARLEVVVPQLEATPMIAPILARRLKDQMPEDDVLTTTIDSNLQLILETMVKDYARQLPDKSSAAVLVVNHQNMAVKAYVASADFHDNERYGQVDMIKAIRSPGSTLKPFLYAMALDQGLLSSHSMLMDDAINIDGYRPKNFNDDFSGTVSMSEALQRSLNIPAIQVLQFLGPGYFHAQLENAGLKLRMPPQSKPNLSLVLGGAGTRLEELVLAYTAFSRGGKVAQLKFIQEPGGSEPVREKYLMSPGAAWIIRDILSKIKFRAPIATMVSSASSLAWKTGTSYGYRDAWAIGMTDDYTIGIWIGRPDGTPVPGQYGAQTAVPLLKTVNANLAVLTKNQPKPGTAVKRPDSVTQQTICWPGGGLPSHTEPGQCLQTHLSWTIDNTVPPVLSRNPEMATTLNEIKIISIDDGTRIQPPQGSEQSVSITLQAQGGKGGTLWFVNGKAINQRARENFLTYTFRQSGQFRITAIDESGQSDHVTVYVQNI